MRKSVSWMGGEDVIIWWNWRETSWESRRVRRSSCKRIGSMSSGIAKTRWSEVEDSSV